MDEVSSYGLWIGGFEQDPPNSYCVRDKYSGEEIARVGEAARSDVERAASTARSVFLDGGVKRPTDRQRVLYRAAEILQDMTDDFTETLVCECGAPVATARAEVQRTISALRNCGEEATRIEGSAIPIDIAEGDQRLAITFRVPLGVVAAITPFNAPLSLAVHKVGPAIAAGNTVVLRPSPQTPITALKLGHVFRDAGLPAGALNVITGENAAVGAWLVATPDVDYINFTGSTRVGREIAASAGLRRYLLELGNNSASIVCDDADIEPAVEAIVRGAFHKAGQVCTSTQSVFVHESVFEDVSRRLVDAAGRLVAGDPRDPRSDIGPLISLQAAERVRAVVRRLETEGATLLCGGPGEGALIPPTIVGGVPEASSVIDEEIFGPVAMLIRFRNLENVFARVNGSKFGLQAGVFTSSLSTALRAALTLDVGGVVINDSSKFRHDRVPYGGVKESGVGREGPAFAVQEMTNVRSFTMRMPT